MNYAEFIGKKYFMVWRDFIQCPYRVRPVCVDEVKIEVSATVEKIQFKVFDVEKTWDNFVVGLDVLFAKEECAKVYITTSVETEFGLRNDVDTQIEKNVLLNIYKAIEQAGYVLNVPKVVFVDELRKRYEASNYDVEKGIEMTLKVGELLGAYLIDRISGGEVSDTDGGKLNARFTIENLEDNDMMQFIALK